MWFEIQGWIQVYTQVFIGWRGILTRVFVFYLTPPNVENEDPPHHHLQNHLETARKTVKTKTLVKVFGNW